MNFYKEVSEGFPAGRYAAYKRAYYRNDLNSLNDVAKLMLDSGFSDIYSPVNRLTKIKFHEIMTRKYKTTY